MRSGTRRILWMLVTVGALACLHVAAGRWKAERANRRVELVLDWDEVRTLADETNTPLPDVLRRFYQAGARGIAIGEDSVGEMQGLRRLELLPPSPNPGALTEMTTALRVPETALRERIRTTLLHKWRVPSTENGSVLTVRAAWPELYGLGVGFPQDVIAAARGAHMEPVLRVSNYLGADAASITWSTASIAGAGGRLVVFGGDQVLGYPDATKTTADAFVAHGLKFGQVEFGKQKGEDDLAKDLRGDIVRVHSINPVEMTRMSQGDAVDRFLRAAEERNIRALYVRMLPGAPQPPVEGNVRYVNAIARAISTDKAAPMEMGLAAPYPPYESNKLERCVMGLGVGAATLLLASYVWPFTGLLLALLVALAALDAVLPWAGFGRKVVALQGALLMPVLAFMVLRARTPGWHDAMEAYDDGPKAGNLLGGALRSIGLFLSTSGISALGALFVVGLLSSRMGTVKISEFSGIKAQQAGAIVLIAAIFYLDVSARGGLEAARARVRRRALEIWGQPLLLGGLALGVVALAVLALLLARSGNDPGVGVSPTEMQFRALLDKLLLVRPRTKEFLIGHPALLLGIALVRLRRFRWSLPVLLIGSIGQVSIVNTFCHLHTPLAVSLFRVVNGLWSGILVGLMLAVVLDALGKPRKAVPLAERVRVG